MFHRQLVPLLASMLVSCASRPKPPPQDAIVPSPWGSVEWEDTAITTATAPAPGIDRAVLALAGAGSRCAYGAGLLCGWSEAGTRPRFQVVTGVSLSAVTAVYAFIGPEADDELREFFTSHKTRDFYRRQGLISALVTGSLNAQGPFIDLLESLIDDDLLGAVAREHAAGRRLFVATTNLDADTLTVWDMGAIASSAREDRIERFRNILLASTSSPAIFPPVYLDVEVDDEQYWQMHVDGSMKAPVFLHARMLDLVAATGAGQGRSAPPQLFVIVSDTLQDLPYSRPVRPTLRNLITAHHSIVHATSREGALYRTYVVAQEANIDFKLAVIPNGYEDPPLPEIFNPARVEELFDVAYDQAATGDPWLTHPPSLDPAEPLERE